MIRLVFIVALLAGSSALAQIEDAPPEVGTVDTRPQGRNIGVGISLGAPTGLTLKYHLDPGTAVQVGVGGAGHGFLSVHADYVFSVATLLKAPEGFMYFYGGLGVGIGLFGSYHPVFGNRYFTNAFFAAADVHLTGGLAWTFREYPVDVFVEVSPGLLVIPGIGFGWHGNVGARYYF